MLLSLSGIASQVKLIWDRKTLFHKGELEGERPTSVLSLNRFSTSFFAFFAMFFYGLTLERFNHYIVWPRVIALAMLLIVLYEIMRDRRDTMSYFIFTLGSVLCAGSLVLALTQYRVTFYEVYASHIFAFCVTCIFAQGAAHQIYKIRKSGSAGALSLRMHQLYALKDFSSVLFGIAMQLDKGWPVIFQHSVSFIVQIATMYHFRWVKDSTLAKERREDS